MNNSEINGLTDGEWGMACDSYGRVQHSKKACVYTVLRGDGGERIVSVAARIPNWADARIMAASKDLYKALRGMNHATEGGYCICPRADGLAADDLHSTACLDARKALRHAESHHADWANDTETPS